MKPIITSFGNILCACFTLAVAATSSHAQVTATPPSYRAQLVSEADALLALSTTKPWGVFWPDTGNASSPAAPPPTTAPAASRRRSPEIADANTTDNALVATALHLAGSATGEQRYTLAALKTSSALGQAQQSSGMVPIIAVAASGKLAGATTDADQYELLPTARAAAMWLALVDAAPPLTQDQPANEAATPRRHALRALSFLAKQQARSGAFTISEPAKTTGPRRERKKSDPIIRLTTTEYRDVLIVLAMGWAELEQDSLWLPIQRATETLLKMRQPAAGAATPWAAEYFADGVAVIPPGRTTAAPDSLASTQAAQALLAVALTSADLAPTPDLAARATFALQEMASSKDAQTSPAHQALVKAAQDLALLGPPDFVKLAGRSAGVRQQFALLVLDLSPDVPGTGRPISRSEAKRYLADNAPTVQQRLIALTGDDLATRARRIALLAHMAEIERMAE